jgi:ABC-type sugar transport system ATPase subunit
VLAELRVQARRGAVVIIASGDAEVLSSCDRVIALTPAGAPA